MPAVTATAARDGRMKKVVGVSRLATSTRAGTSRERRTLVMTTPMKMSNPVQVPPVITWMKVSRYRLLLTKAAIRTRGGMTPMAKLQRSSRLVYGGSVEGRARNVEGSEVSVAGPGSMESPDRTRPPARVKNCPAPAQGTGLPEKPKCRAALYQQAPARSMRPRRARFQVVSALPQLPTPDCHRAGRNGRESEGGRPVVTVVSLMLRRAARQFARPPVWHGRRRSRPAWRQPSRVRKSAP